MKDIDLFVYKCHHLLVADRAYLEKLIGERVALEPEEALERLVVVKELREETSRLKSEGLDPSLDIAIPADWLPLLARGLKREIEKSEEDSDDDEPDDIVAPANVEHMRTLMSIISDAEVNNSCTIGPDYHVPLWLGLCGAVRRQEFLATVVNTPYYPLSLRFVTQTELMALRDFFWVVLSIVENATASRP